MGVPRLMCGVAADLRRPGGAVDRGSLAGMIACQKHRGPDGQRLWVAPDRSAGLAHARLSIVDLSPAGDQPMTNEDQSLHLACNGEIYNHRELRGALSARGHRFRSGSDNEVVLHGYEEWGIEGLLGRLRGMFAFLLYDVARRRLVAARDRLGEKPLVYAEDDQGVVLASEIPALRRSGRVGDRIDPRAIAYFLARNLRHVPDPLCAFAEARKLPPAHMLVVEEGTVVECARWWRPTWRGARATEAELRTVVEEAVSLQRQADVEVGALLSGGVDSSIVVGLAARDGQPPRTYALGRDLDDPEIHRARRASERFGTRHHEAFFAAAQLGRLDALIGQLGEPLALLPATHADALIARVRADGLRVVLTGNGADEILFGYSGVPRLRVASALLRLGDMLPAVVRRTLAHVPLSGDAGRIARLAAVPALRRKEALYREDVAEAAELLAPELRPHALMPERCPVFGPWSDAFDGRDYIELSQFLTLMVEDAHSVTIVADVAGMHHSVECRSPFLDHRVAETCFRLPIRHKAGGFIRPVGKRALRRAFAGLIGDDLAAAPKMGFGFSLQEGELIRGPLRRPIEERILGGTGLGQIMNTALVERRVAEHMSGDRDWGKLLLSLYAIESWHEQLVAPGTSRV